MNETKYNRKLGNKIATGMQTEGMDKEGWAEMRVVEMVGEEQHRSIPRARPLSSKFKDYEMKYVSLTTGKCKKTLMLKVDQMSRPL